MRGDEAVAALDANETLSLLETRHYRWDCGCSETKMHGILAPLMRRDPEALFGGEDVIRMSCPRCGMKYVITRAALTAALGTAEG